MNFAELLDKKQIKAINGEKGVPRENSFLECLFHCCCFASFWFVLFCFVFVKAGEPAHISEEKKAY